MPIAKRGTLLPRNAAVNIFFPSQSDVGKHPLHHSCNSSSYALGHTIMLRRIGAGVLDNDVRLKAVVLGFLCD